MPSVEIRAIEAFAWFLLCFERRRQDFLKELDDTFPELGIYKQGRIQTSPGVEEPGPVGLTEAPAAPPLPQPSFAGDLWQPDRVLSLLART